jgi:hypothetical protein
MNRVLLIYPDRGSGFKLIVSGNRELGIGIWDLAIGNWQEEMDYWYFFTS